MKPKHALEILIIVFLILGSGATAPATAQSPAGSDLRVLSSNGHEIVLELTVDDFRVETIEHAGQTYQRVIIPGMAQTDTPGAPQVPVRGAMLGLPGVIGVSVEILEANYETFSGYRLWPSPRLEMSADNLDDLMGGELQRTFTLERETYTSDAFYPGRLVEIGYTGHVRDQAVAQVQFHPAQYNPVSGELRLYRRIRARVIWSTPRLATTSDTPVASPAYENLLSNTVLNYGDLERPGAPEAQETIAITGIRALATSSPTATLKIGVSEDGLYELTYDDLTSAGLDLSGVDPRNIKISNRGVELPIYVYGEDDGVFTTTDSILFYGTAITDVYTTENIYWLTPVGGAGQRMSAIDGTPLGSAVPTSFPVTLHAEEDNYYWQTMPNGAGQDHWFWEGRLTAPASRPYTLTLNNISTTATTTTVRVRLKGRTDIAAVNPDHHTRVYLNGHEIDDQTWDGQIIYDHEVTAPHSYLAEGSNVITVESVGDTGAPVDQVFVNWIEIDYRDTYVAENDELLFGAPLSGTFQFEVTGFTTNTVQVFDVTDPTAVAIITNTTVVVDGGGYKLQFEDTAQPETRYLALTPTQHKSPASIEQDQASSWRSTGHGADYIIITHEDFYTSSLTLADHRAITSGLRVATVKVGDIYDEFNYGIFNPQAIRDFLSYAYHNWTAPAPAYVLLVGDASQDYRDNLGTGLVNYVPSQIIETDLLGETPSDNWFVLVSGGDILPDMFIGRLTARTASEADDMVDKIIYYEQNPPDNSWNTDALLVADNDDPVFEATSEQLAGLLPYYYDANKVYVDDYPPGNPTTDIANYINAGSILVNYAGHGNVDMWRSGSSGHIFDRPDVTALGNTHRLAVVTVANCLNGFFVGTTTSMAEEFLRLPDKGAVAVWAPTGLGYPSGHRALMRELYEAIFQDDQYALGASTTATKIAAYNQNNLWGELVETFVLFGDPATQLGIPTNYPYLESTTPADGASDVPLDQDIHIVFSKPMSTATVSLGGPGAAGLTLTPTWSDDNTVLNYTHTGFGYGETRVLTISGQDNLGNLLGAGPVPSTWSFTTPTAPDDVLISGPAAGVVQVDYTFDAAVGPITATLPITYTWQATGQSPVTHTGGGLDDTATFNWDTPGAKTITVTAANAIGSANNTYEMTLDYSPPTDALIAGPTKAAINTAYTFDVAVSPITATQPITYVWHATNQSLVTHTGGDLDDTVSFTWDVTGTQTITVTAANAGGAVTQTHQVTVTTISVDIAGPTTGVVQVGYTFTATVNPVTTTTPITYTWQATGQSPVVHTGGGLDDTVSFAWDTPGAKTITVTASNAKSTATNTYEVTLDYAPPTEVTIAGPTTGITQTVYAFDATVSPITATLPITYTWQATNQSSVTHTGSDLDDTISFIWNVTGTQTITVTAANAGGAAANIRSITINEPSQGPDNFPVFLPLVIRNN